MKHFPTSARFATPDGASSGGSVSYRDAGVDIEAGEHFVERIRDAVESTRTGGVLGAVGGFGGLFAPDLSRVKEPVLVSSAD
ncbi:hypothetical protein K8I85_18320, partial [bacterium]|nr:hypothetical protein [bacterium]